MKIFLCILFLPLILFAQADRKPERKLPNININLLNSDSNSITVIINDSINRYNLNDSIQAKKLMSYLSPYLENSKNIQQLLKNNTNEILYLVKNIYRETNSRGVLNTKALVDKLEEYIVENTRHKIEIEELLKQSKDTILSKLLIEASLDINQFRSRSYLDIIKEFLIFSKFKNASEKREFSNTIFLLAQNNFSNYHFKDALEQINQSLQLDSHNVNILFLKAQILSELGKFNDCLIIYNRITEINSNDTLTSLVYGNAAAIYRKEAFYDKALMLYNKQLSINLTILKIDSLIAKTYFDISSLYWENNDFDTSLIYSYKAINYQDKLYKKYKQDENCSTLLDFTAKYFNLGKYDKAVKYAFLAIEAANKTIIADSECIARAYNYLGNIYEVQQENIKSMEYYELAIAVAERTMGKNHPVTGSYYYSLGRMYEYFEPPDYLKALSLYLKYLEVINNLYSEPNKYVAEQYAMVAEVYFHLKNYQPSMEYYSKAIEVFNHFASVGKPVIVEYYCNIAQVFHRLNELDSASYYYSKSIAHMDTLTQRSKALCKWQQNKIKTLDTLANIYMEMKKYPEAIEVYSKLLEEEKTAGPLAFQYGLKEFTINNTILSLATAHERTGNTDKALHIYLNLLDTVYKPKDKYLSEVSITYLKIANLYCGIRDFSSAMKNLKNVEPLKLKIKYKNILKWYYATMCGVFLEEKDYYKMILYSSFYIKSNQELFSSDDPSYTNIFIESLRPLNFNYDLHLKYLNEIIVSKDTISDLDEDIKRVVNEEIGLSMIAKGKTSEGLEILSKSIFVFKTNASRLKYLNVFGVSLFRNEKYQEAIYFYESALEYISGVKFFSDKWMLPIIYQNIAKSKCLQGKRDEAIELFEKAISLYKDEMKKNVNIDYIKKNFDECKTR